MVEHGWKLEIGEEVDAQHGGGTKCYPAIIQAVCKGEATSCKYDLKYADGDTELAVDASLVHALVREDSSAVFEFIDAPPKWGGQENVLSKYVGGGAGFLIGQPGAGGDFLLPVGVELHATSRVKILREVTRVKEAWGHKSRRAHGDGGVELYKRRWVDAVSAGEGGDDGEDGGGGQGSMADRPSFQCMQCAVLSEARGRQQLAQAEDEGRTQEDEGRTQPWLAWAARRWRVVEEIFTIGPDILCMQGLDHFADFMMAALGAAGFEGRFQPGTMHCCTVILYSCCTRTVLILCSYCARTVLVLYSYCTHTVLILCSYCAHTVVVLCSYCTRTVLILYSYCAHTAPRFWVVQYIGTWVRARLLWRGGGDFLEKGRVRAS
jgi:hypothetical protein